ncbi:MAG: hypothetical protein LIO77_07305 [Rikenellaceae bacterium]|nr:hypothetical protein [Rikenellaceae bacterium]
MKLTLISIPLTCFLLSSARPGSSPKEPAARPELRTFTDSVSYLLGCEVGNALLLEGNLSPKSLNIKVFLAAMEDTFNENPMDIKLDDDRIFDFIETESAKLLEQSEQEAWARVRQRMEEEGYIYVDENTYCKVIKQGEGKPATREDQTVTYIAIHYDRNGNVPLENLPFSGVDSDPASRFTKIFGGPVEFLCQGSVFHIAFPDPYPVGTSTHSDPSFYRFTRFEILEVED